ncbi:MAG: Unknown protein [uncultured Thiotrichaceae bacterium]|uniref:Lipoprotein n=1 Tax=uncultured Thiotrichaceae bacterium TaxID=298394 RepID=A0A6S6U4V4_9GAMM|nr:MAG: Unknown protein [uncultured Thiotrichaceae bacterium]
MDVIKNKKWVISLLAVLLLAACSTAQFGYRFLDNLMRWEVNKYVSLVGQQSTDLDQALDVFHAWHRSSQLPVYSEFLDQQGKVLAAPVMSGAQLQQAYNRAMSLWRVSARQLLPDLTQLISSLDEAQVAQLQKNMDKKNREFEEEYLKPSREARRAEREEKMVDRLKKWIGDPDDQQLELVKQWVDTLSFEMPPRVEQRQLMRQRFEAALKVRSEPVQLQRLLAGIVVNPEQNWTPAYRKYLQFNRQQTYQLMIKLHASLSQQQKDKLLGKLAGYQQDFANLSRQ